MKKALAALLALSMLLSMMAACGSSGESASDTAAASASEAEVSAEAPAAADETAEADAASAEETTAIEIETADGPVAGEEDFDWSVYGPLAEEPTTLTMFYSQPPMLASLEDSPNDFSYLYQKFEEITNIHIEFHIVNMMDASTNFTLMVASGDMDDILNDVMQYYSAADQAVEDGAAVDILEYADSMPNFMNLLETYPSMATDLKTDSGMAINFPRVDMVLKESSDTGLVIRQDWLDELGLEVPKSYDEMHDVLVAFKEAYNISDPYVMPYQVLSPWGLMAGGYGIVAVPDTTNFYINDGVIEMATISDAYYEYLCMFRDWYEEGLISPDFTSYQSNLPDDTLISNEQTGIWFSDVSYIKTYEEMLAAVNPDAQLALMGDPGIDEAKSGYIGDEASMFDVGGFSISECCDDIELAVAWCDMWYDPALTQFINYGYEGVTFEYDEDGNPVLGGEITNNDLGLTTKLATGFYLCTGGGFIYDWHKYDTEYSDLQLATYTEWIYKAEDESTVTTWKIPNAVSPDPDEASTISTIMGDINTYVSEMALKFVTGDRELNEETYAEYVAAIEAMNVQEALDAQQSAYDRYLER